jgi:pyruvate/2-oxoglutarate dehydrogenase complex dihydrolipoamide acyltransferase (E2) component
MRKFIVRSFAITLIVSAAWSGDRAVAQNSAQSPPSAPQVEKAKNGAAVAAAPAASTANKGAVAATKVAKKSQRNYRQTRGDDPAIAAWGRTSYNYTGIGFPRMEGGLTAAANRTTWLKPMYPPHRRGRW